MKRDWMVAAVLSLACLVSGCGADCAAICEEQKKCDEGAVPEDTDCEKSCEANEKKAEGKGCESQYEENLSCADEQDDKCELGDCTDEQKALDECVEG